MRWPPGWWTVFAIGTPSSGGPAGRLVRTCAAEPAPSLRRLLDAGRTQDHGARERIEKPLAAIPPRG